MKTVVSCKVALLVAIFLFCFISVVVVNEARGIRTDTGGAGARHSSQSNLYVVKEDEYLEEDSMAVDYTPARKKTPIHN
ncbi:hypothetical protein F0562_027482 [Nyssa sinensis]|uniref:Uncharacterized protein n=1 Tax=Nyssa sinensis TaxID=561372 RepID=A0A5J5B5K2_9ASTE|nr:hypothetical protein F0562_027482 [Nyssa sinensis]